MSVSIRAAETNYKMLRPGDKCFSFSPDGISVIPRASIEISLDCPRQYMTIISECFNKGWIRPVATIRGTEYTMEVLKNG